MENDNFCTHHFDRHGPHRDMLSYECFDIETRLCIYTCTHTCFICMSMNKYILPRRQAVQTLGDLLHAYTPTLRCSWASSCFFPVFLACSSAFDAFSTSISIYSKGDLARWIEDHGSNGIFEYIHAHTHLDAANHEVSCGLSIGCIVTKKICKLEIFFCS